MSWGRCIGSLVGAAVGAVFAAGCAAPDEGVGGGGPQAHAERFAVVTLSYDEAEEDPGHDALNVQALFVEHAGVGEQVAVALLNAPHEGLVDASIPLDGCVVEVRPAAALEPEEGVGRVTLLDAGEVFVELPAGSVMLEGHYFPELYAAVGGLQYDGVLRDRAAFGSGPRVTVTADGSDEVGEFSVALAVPPVIHLQTIGGEPARRARRWAPDDGGLEVGWGPAAGGDGNDVVMVQVVRQGFERVARARCAVVDDGQFVVPEAALAALADVGPEATERVVVARVRTAPFAAAGMADGLVVAIARDAVVLD